MVLALGSAFWKAPFITVRTAMGKRRICTKPVMTVSRPPTITRIRGMANGCQTNESSVRIRAVRSVRFMESPVNSAGQPTMP
jgi:hypothetical protein